MGSGFPKLGNERNGNCQHKYHFAKLLHDASAATAAKSAQDQKSGRENSG
jgi:hypothetical protein